VAEDLYGIRTICLDPCEFGWKSSLQRLRRDFSFYCNKSIVWIYFSGDCCDVFFEVCLPHSRSVRVRSSTRGLVMVWSLFLLVSEQVGSRGIRCNIWEPRCDGSQGNMSSTGADDIKVEELVQETREQGVVRRFDFYTTRGVVPPRGAVVLV